MMNLFGKIKTFSDSQTKFCSVFLKLIPFFLPSAFREPYLHYHNHHQHHVPIN